MNYDVIIDGFSIRPTGYSIVCADNFIGFDLRSHKENLNLIKKWIAKKKMTISISENFSPYIIDEYTIEPVTQKTLLGMIHVRFNK